MDLTAHSTSALLQACRYLGGHMAQRPELLVAIWSIVNKSTIRSKGDQETSLLAGDQHGTDCTWLVTESLVPAVLCSQGSVGVSRWIFEHPDSPLRHLAYSQRYALYLHPHCHGQRSLTTDDTTDSVLIPFWQALYRSMGKRLLRRLAGDTVGMIAKSLEPVLNSGPWSVSRIIMEQIQSYDNLVVPVADMLVWPLRAAEQTTRAYPSEMIYATAFSLDVFFAVTLDELAGPQTNSRPRLRRDGTGIAPWFLNTIELVVQLSVRLAQRLATYRLAASSIDTSRTDSAPWDALCRVLDDWWRALLHLAYERMIQGDYAFYALVQRALECMGGIQPWDDEMMSDAQLESLAKDQPQLANDRSSKSGSWNLLERASGSDPGRHDNLKVWSLLVAIDNAKQRLVAEPHHADLSLKALAALVDALHATFLQLARFLGIAWMLREASETGAGESWVSTTAAEEMSESLSTAGYLYLFRIRNRTEPSPSHRHALGPDSLKRSISALFIAEDSRRAARLSKAGVSTLSELVSADWLYLFWSTDQPPDRASLQWFGPSTRHQVNADEQDERVQLVAEFLLERCFLPRVLAAPAEYRCVVAWMLLLAREPNIAPFNLLLLLTILFKTAFLLLQGMTRLECIRMARFVREMLRLVDRWRRQGPDSWERQRLSSAAFQGRGGAPCQWSQFVLWYELMREKMLNVACDALEMLPRPLTEQRTLSSGTASHQVTPDMDSEPGHERNPERVSCESAHLSLGNILRALNIMVEEFPSRSHTAGERIEKALSSIIEREQNVSDDDEQHTDILTLATSYLGRLRARRLGLEARRAPQRTSGGPRPEARAFSSRAMGSSSTSAHHPRANTDTSPERPDTRIGARRSSVPARPPNVSSNPRRSDERPGREDPSLSHRERPHRPPPGSWPRAQRRVAVPERRPNVALTANEPPRKRVLNPQITGSSEHWTGPRPSSERDANGKLVKPGQERRTIQGMRHTASLASTGGTAQPQRTTGAPRDERQQQQQQPRL
ncbi:THO complex subunit 2 [Cyanidiococcus yangmingshanensis]|uniref:THO complex subunit 2 n=1 Tax=Cyanidiococcus yangmingshanensis TaxID=2690220 RepID=A0A7J7IEC1_9RHOD|nr:THO complex subunit 2 [Cyanidiococcus yangmingshanensis]